jgi:hypothetical protein
LANWLLKESNFSCSLARESSIAMLRMGVVGLEVSDGEGGDLLFFLDGIEKYTRVNNEQLCVEYSCSGGGGGKAGSAGREGGRAGVGPADEGVGGGGGMGVWPRKVCPLSQNA